MPEENFDADETATSSPETAGESSDSSEQAGAAEEQEDSPSGGTGRKAETEVGPAADSNSPEAVLKDADEGKVPESASLSTGNMFTEVSPAADRPVLMDAPQVTVRGKRVMFQVAGPNKGWPGGIVKARIQGHPSVCGTSFEDATEKLKAYLDRTVPVPQPRHR